MSKLGHILDTYWDEIKKDERPIGTIQADTERQIKALVDSRVASAELKARLNLIDYLDQVPRNEHMDWKGLLSDCRQLLKDDAPGVVGSENPSHNRNTPKGGLK